MANAVVNPVNPVKREFVVEHQRSYNHAGPVRWVLSHALRYRLLVALFLLGVVLNVITNTAIPDVIGAAFNGVLAPHPNPNLAPVYALAILALYVANFLTAILFAFCVEFLAQRLEADTRDELYLNLLGKSQTFHNQQRVGDIMARANNDVRQINVMVNPGASLVLSDSILSLIIPLIFIAALNVQLLLAPLLFTVAFILALRHYTRELAPVSAAMRESFGDLNAGLAESITGIEVVKATGQETQERRKFTTSARAYRDHFIRNGQVQARYLPLLLFALAMVVAFLHGLLLVNRGALNIGALVAYLGLMGLLAIPANTSIWAFNLIQLGLAGADRILALLRQESELDENAAGYAVPMRGEITFENVSFSYGGEPALRDLTFTIRPGETLAIVGQTGAGKSTLTKLVNRTYDATSGRVLVDGVDVRAWSLDALRSQISTIEQDIFLFSRSITENIAFGQGPNADANEVERAAREAQADGFIREFRDGYATVIGERGVTLSGGQRQRLAIARALLTDPRILILDDSTSAIDSATEDEIQKAIRRLQEGRTTLLITHRLSQIRWADRILVLRRGAPLDLGTHDELMARCALYRRIFARYGKAQPVTQQATEHGPSLNDHQPANTTETDTIEPPARVESPAHEG